MLTKNEAILYINNQITLSRLMAKARILYEEEKELSPLEKMIYEAIISANVEMRIAHNELRQFGLKYHPETKDFEMRIEAWHHGPFVDEDEIRSWGLSYLIDRDKISFEKIRTRRSVLV